MEIRIDSLESKKSKQLLTARLQDINATLKKEIVHAFNVSGLKHASVTFWSI